MAKDSLTDKQRRQLMAESSQKAAALRAQSKAKGSAPKPMTAGDKRRVEDSMRASRERRVSAAEKAGATNVRKTATTKANENARRAGFDISRSASEAKARSPAAIQKSLRETPVTKPAPKKSAAPAPAPKRDTPPPKLAVKAGSPKTGSVKTGGGDYAVYKRGSAKANEFQAAYKAAKKGSTFTWDGRKYKKD